MRLTVKCYLKLWQFQLQRGDHVIDRCDLALMWGWSARVNQGRGCLPETYFAPASLRPSLPPLLTELPFALMFRKLT